MVKTYTVDKPLFKLGNTLGEGCVWVRILDTEEAIRICSDVRQDSRSKRLYFVDIDQKKLYTYEPSSGTIGYEVFDHKITAIALLEKDEGLIAVADGFFAFIPPSSIPFPPTGSRQPLKRIPTSVTLSSNEKRFNDGAVDPRGRFIAGTMGFEHGSKYGKMYALSKGTGNYWEAPLVQEGVTCTNGMGWSKDGKTMYFTDSWVKEIVTFDYDLVSGKMENRRVLSNLQDYGEPDGMCQDTDGGIWTCRWQAGRVIRLTESGDVDVIIDFPTAWHMTCCVFGGENNDELYVTTAASDYNGEILPDRYDGGSLFVVKGLGFTGVERGRFRGSVEDLP